MLGAPPSSSDLLVNTHERVLPVRGYPDDIIAASDYMNANPLPSRFRLVSTLQQHMHSEAYNATVWPVMALPEELRNPDREGARRHREVIKIVHEVAERIKQSRASGTPIVVGQPQKHRMWCTLVRWMDLVHGCH